MEGSLASMLTLDKSLKETLKKPTFRQDSGLEASYLLDLVFP